jgi:hypothetical protein
MLMALVALALVLSLVATLAPDASAQDSGAAPDGPAKWMRYRMPAAQDMESAADANFVDIKRNCCITVQSDGHPNGGTIDVSSAQQNHCLESPRWYCVNHYQNNFY